MSDRIAEQLHENNAKESQDDKEIVENFLVDLTGSSFYAKGIRQEKHKLNRLVQLDKILTSNQIKILLSPRYLDTSLQYSPGTDCETSLPQIKIKHLDQSFFISLTNGISDDGARSLNPERAPLIDQLIQQYNTAVDSKDKTTEFVRQKAKQFHEWIETLPSSNKEYLGQTKSNNPEIYLIAVIKLWNFYIKNVPAQLNVVQDLIDDVRQISSIENDANIKEQRSIGCEIEIPYTGKLTRTSFKPSTYVTIPGQFFLLQQLGIPIEDDKNGEVALPKSKSPAIQAELLEGLKDIGFCPRTSRLAYTLHTNISVTESEYSRLKLIRPDELAAHRLNLMAYVLGKRYSSSERLLYGAYTDPYTVKGTDKTEFRLEIRTLQFDPSMSKEDFCLMLENIRLYTDSTLSTLSTDTSLSSSPYEKFVTRYANIVCGEEKFTGIDEAELYLLTNMASIIDVNSYDNLLNQIFDEFIDNLKRTEGEK